MSVDCMSAVWNLSEQSGTDRLLLLALADYADDGGFCWPQVQALAKKTKMSRSTVLRAIARIEKSGELYVSHNRRTGNKYIVAVGMPRDKLLQSLQKYFGLSYTDAKRYLDGPQQEPPAQQPDPPDKCHSDTKHDGRDKSHHDTSEVSSSDTSEVSSVELQDPSRTVIDPPKDSAPAARTEFQAIQEIVVNHWFDGDWANASWAGDIANLFLGRNTKDHYKPFNFQKPWGPERMEAFAAWIKAQGISYPTKPAALRRQGMKFEAIYKPPQKQNLPPPDPDCPICGGAGLVLSSAKVGEPGYGQTKLCRCRTAREPEAAAS